MKKTIAFVIGSLSSGGAERVISTLSNELVNSYEVCIITFVEKKPFYPLDERVKVISCQDSARQSTNIFERLTSNYSLYRRIKTILKVQNVDVCLGFLPRSNILSIFASQSLNIPVIICERNDPESVGKNFIWDTFRKYTYSKAHFLVVQTKEIKRFFTSLVDADKIHILPNPLSPDFQNTGIDDSSREKIILNVGRLTKQKNQRTLIEAFYKLNPEGWKLIIVGEGYRRKEYEKMILDFGMQERILLPGRKTNISDYYNEAKIFAFTSLFEGFPNALIEAMYMGLPCISIDCPTGPSELISDGNNGFLVEIGNEIDFVEKLDQLIQNPELRKKFSAASGAVIEKYRVQNVLKEWEKIIFASLKN